MVNYHAIGLYCTSRLGFVLHDPQEEASLKVSALVFTGEDDVVSTRRLDNKRPERMSAAPCPGPHTRNNIISSAWIGNEVERLSAVLMLVRASHLFSPY
mmetsp:Transcript_15024/g.46644  ORF Transcript_15024/g.46644 Transcript_15024/m.46644 type:complete len:99 (+) Transcript_15024:1118-1414(+)